jgi:hypothetical protein
VSGTHETGGSYQKAAAATIPTSALALCATRGTSSKPLKYLAIEEAIG